MEKNIGEKNANSRDCGVSSGKNSKYLGITIDLDRDKNIRTTRLKLLKDYYCKDGEDSPQQAFARLDQLHIVMMIWNSHKEFMITFLKGGLCLHHLFYQMHQCLDKR